tara:strand:+ start:132 stop:332 length:201 start_codon:yes stop_codon:yes gene_type:complete
MNNKYGTYIQKLMTVVIDNEHEEFVRKLAWQELKQISDGIVEFTETRRFQNSKEKQENPKQELLFG